MIAGFRKSHARIAPTWSVSGALACLLAVSTPSVAGTGQPTPWQIDFQTAVTPVMDAIYSFHAFLTILSAVITLFVLVTLVWEILRYNITANWGVVTLIFLAIFYLGFEYWKYRSKKLY